MIIGIIPHLWPINKTGNVISRQKPRFMSSLLKPSPLGKVTAEGGRMRSTPTLITNRICYQPHQFVAAATCRHVTPNCRHVPQPHPAATYPNPIPSCYPTAATYPPPPNAGSAGG